MRLKLTEYGAPAVVSWDNDILDALKDESRRWKDVLGLNYFPFEIEYIEQGKHSIKARGVTGFIQIDSVSIEIRPKFLSSEEDSSWRRALWKILTAVEEQPEIGALSQAEATEEDKNLSDLFGWILLDSIRRGRLEGFPRGYVEARGSLPLLRGSLDITRVSDLIVRPYLIPCVFDVFCEDTPINRLFRWATNQLAAAVRSPQLARMLTDEAAAFTEVGAYPPGLIVAESLALPIQYQHLVPALQVSRLLLRRQSLQHQQENYSAPSFLWKSAEIFEKFIGFLLHQLFDNRRGWYIDSNAQVLADRNGRNIINTFPDYRIVNGKGTSAVLDAKYKVLGRFQRPKTQDVYQVLAAGRINNCNTGFLVYPSSNGTRKLPVTWKVRGDGQPTHVTAVFINLLEMGNISGDETLSEQLMKDINTESARAKPNHSEQK